jgi:hypothetical protein
VDPAIRLPADGPADVAALGKELLGLAVLAEHQGWDAEAALRQQVRSMHTQIRGLESQRAESPPSHGE